MVGGYHYIVICNYMDYLRIHESELGLRVFINIALLKLEVISVSIKHILVVSMLLTIQTD